MIDSETGDRRVRLNYGRRVTERLDEISCSVAAE